MKVLKFGGTSVGTIDSLRNVRSIIEGLESPAVVVVSALGGLTDRLILTARAAADGSDSYPEEMKGIRLRHHDIIDALVPEQRREELRRKVDALLDELENRYRGLALIRLLPERTLDEVVSFGERMSSLIVAGLLPDAEWHDSLEFMKTEKWFSKNIADRSLTDRLIRREFPEPLKRHVVIGGFIARDRDTGEITNLGRGGSDYTAALVAASLDADMLEIWTDVDGFLTADPRVIPDARIIPEMSFVESMELCSFGAKVVYPPTIYPVFHKNIPIKILNTFRPEAPGTLISDHAESAAPPRGISSLGNTAVISMRGPLTANVAEVNSRAYNVMARNGISLFLVSPPWNENSFSMAMPQGDMAKAMEMLRLEFAPELESGELMDISGREELAVVSVVGDGIRRCAGLGARLVNTLQRQRVEVCAVSDGASETTIAIVVPQPDVKEALRLVHQACFGS